MPQTTRVASDRSGFPSPPLFACILCFLSVSAVGVVSRYALLTALVDALSAAVIVVPAALGGLWLTSLCRLGPLPRRWQLIFGAALGLGAIAILVLVGGLLGLLNRTLWIVLLCAFAAAGVVRLWRIRSSAQDEKCAAPSDRGGSAARWRLLWIVAAPFLTLALLAASNAPGFIWQEEGNGYDVLEYHLQLPKEYLQDGRIAYQPHNVYANFPANVEMLYLLAMVVHGDPLEAGTVANMIHLFLAALTVAAAWAIGRDGSPRAGVVCGVMAATTGWLESLSGLAYVENGMLFFGMCAAAAMLRALRSARPCTHDRSAETVESASPTRWAALSGVLAGLACGCKYTAVALIALPLLPAVALMPFRLSEKIKAGLVFVLGTLVAFSPWLVKNQFMTGNPVFPLVNDLFRAAPQGWSAEQTQQWDRGHTLKSDERTLSARVRSLWVRVAGDADQRFGPTILALGLVGLLSRRRDNADAALVLMLALQMSVWTLATHEYARFAVPLIIPLAIFGGRTLPAGASNQRAVLVAAAIVGGAAWNLTFAAFRHARESPGGAPAALFYEGRVPGFEYLGAANEELPEDAKVLLVGEARAFYFRRKVDYCVAFNRSPFLEMIHADDAPPGLTTWATRAPGVMDWLGGRGYTHILVNWSEVRRLERTFGLAPPTTAAQLERVMARLEQEGLSLVRAFNHPNPEVHARYVELYAVPPGRQAPDAR